MLFSALICAKVLLCNVYFLESRKNLPEGGRADGSVVLEQNGASTQETLTWGDMYLNLNWVQGGMTEVETLAAGRQFHRTVFLPNFLPTYRSSYQHNLTQLIQWLSSKK